MNYEKIAEEPLSFSKLQKHTLQMCTIYQQRPLCRAKNFPDEAHYLSLLFTKFWIKVFTVVGDYFAFLFSENNSGKQFRETEGILVVFFRMSFQNGTTVLFSSKRPK